MITLEIHNKTKAVYMSRTSLCIYYNSKQTLSEERFKKQTPKTSTKWSWMRCIQYEIFYNPYKKLPGAGGLRSGPRATGRGADLPVKNDKVSFGISIQVMDSKTTLRKGKRKNSDASKGNDKITKKYLTSNHKIIPWSIFKINHRLIISQAPTQIYHCLPII